MESTLARRLYDMNKERYVVCVKKVRVIEQRSTAQIGRAHV